MKPRHTAEQSTVEVNKSAKLGKFGFASVFKRVEEPIGAKTEAQVQEKITTASVKEITKVSAEREIVSRQIFAKVQTQLSEPENKENFQTKTIDGKTYKVHDPQDKFTCDSCQ